MNQNKYKPDFKQLSEEHPPLKKYLYFKHNTWLLDWRIEGCVIELNKAILRQRFNIYWSVPLKGFLVPCLTSREEYLDWIVDIVNKTKFDDKIYDLVKKSIDIGTGSSLIYPLIGYFKYNYEFIATDINQLSLDNCNEIIEKNNLKGKITLILNKDKFSIFHCVDELLEKDKLLSFSLCNPPYFINAKGINPDKYCSFNSDEVIFDGGEIEFVKNIIAESFLIKDKVLWFSSHVGIRHNYNILKDYINFYPNIQKVITDEITSGKQTRFYIAWTYINVDSYVKPNDSKEIVNFLNKKRTIN